MSHVATFIAAPGSVLDAARLDSARAMLAHAQAPVWLAPGEAADIRFSMSDDGADAVAARRNLAGRLAAQIGGAVDCIVQRDDAFRRKALIVADMDSTMIGQECIDELADFVGRKAEVSAITERAMRGEIDFAPALRERVALLRGLPAQTIDTVIAERITLTPGGATLIATMHAHGAYAALVSGGFTLFTQHVAARLGFDEHRANRLETAEARLTGQVSEPVLGRQAKLEALVSLRDARGLDPRATLAIGDGANDLAMLGAAGLGVAWRARPAVAAAAQARLDNADLTALLFAQGYRRAQFVERG